MECKEQQAFLEPFQERILGISERFLNTHNIPVTKADRAYLKHFHDRILRMSERSYNTHNIPGTKQERERATD